MVVTPNQRPVTGSRELKSDLRPRRSREATQGGVS